MLEQISVIVPIAPGDTAWRSLLVDLRPLPTGAEILLAAASEPPDDFDDLLRQTSLKCPVTWLVGRAGRATQLNHGAARATNRFLLFLHCDSRISEAAFDALSRSLARDDRAIYFFDLVFVPDGPRLMWLNGWGANLRSRWLKLPFGDQGLCISAFLFQRLGIFDEQAPRGEDHLLIWKAHQLGIPVKPTGATIATSARRYAENGWLWATCVCLYRTGVQAMPQWIRLLAARLTGRSDNERNEPRPEFQPSDNEIEKPRPGVNGAQQRRCGILTDEPKAEVVDECECAQSPPNSRASERQQG
jgi:hypothetical protein